MDISSLKRNVLRDENSQNMLTADGEGWKLPIYADKFATLSGTGGAYYWKNNSASHGSLIGRAPINAKQIEAFTGDGATLAFTGGTFGVAVKSAPLHIFAVIGSSIKGWTDVDGVRQTITNRVIGEGTGAQLSFTLYCGTTSVRPSTLTIKHSEASNVRTGTDNGAGTISGTNISSATINYENGAIVVTFSNAPDIGTYITVDYTVDSYIDIEKIEVLAPCDGATSTFTDIGTKFGGIKLNSVRLTAKFSGVDYYFSDDGAGDIVEIGAGAHLTSGTVNYVTGAVALSFATAPDAATGLTIGYQVVGLNRMSVTHATGADIELRFDAGHAPDNGSKVLMLAATAAVGEFAGNSVTTGTLVIGQSARKAGFRSSRSFRDVTSEDYDLQRATLVAVPGSVYALSFYGKTTSGTGSCLIRAWTGDAVNTQVSFDASSLDWKTLTGDVTRVVDPDDGSKFCLKCSMTTALTRFGAMVKTPAGANCISMEWGGDTTCAYFGQQSLWVSGILWNAGSQLASYVQNPATRAITLPAQDPLGTLGQIPVSDGLGGTTWADFPEATGGGGGGILQLNSLSQSIQNFSTTTATAQVIPTFSSAGSTHTLELPLASSPGVLGGLVSKAQYDALAAVPGATITTTNLTPTFTTGTNGVVLELPMASSGTNVLGGLISGMEFAAAAAGMVTAIDSNTAITTANKQRIVMTSAGDRVVTLHVPAGTGHTVELVNTTATTTVNCAGAFVFQEGSTNGTLTLAGEAWTLVSDNVNNVWRLV